MPCISVLNLSLIFEFERISYFIHNLHQHQALRGQEYKYMLFSYLFLRHMSKSMSKDMAVTQRYMDNFKLKVFFIF